MYRRFWVSAALLLLVLLPAAAEVPLPEVPLPDDGGDCVAPTDEIRRNHMDYLVHQRRDTVHQGIRTPKYSLIGCVECHAQTDATGAPVPINAEGQFCQGCHAYAAVRLDCFQCHASVPDSNAKSAGLEPAKGAGDDGS